MFLGLDLFPCKYPSNHCLFVSLNPRQRVYLVGECVGAVERNQGVHHHQPVSSPHPSCNIPLREMESNLPPPVINFLESLQLRISALETQLAQFRSTTTPVDATLHPATTTAAAPTVIAPTAPALATTTAPSMPAGVAVGAVDAPTAVAEDTPEMHLGDLLTTHRPDPATPAGVVAFFSGPKPEVPHELSPSLTRTPAGAFGASLTPLQRQMHSPAPFRAGRSPEPMLSATGEGIRPESVSDRWRESRALFSPDVPVLLSPEERERELQQAVLADGHEL